MDKYKTLFNIAGAVDVVNGAVMVAVLLLILLDESIISTKLFNLLVTGYGLILFWIPSVFFILAWSCPDEENSVTSQLRSLLCLEFPPGYGSHEKKHASVRHYRLSYQAKTYLGLIYQCAVVGIIKMFPGKICPGGNESDICELLVDIGNMCLVAISIITMVFNLFFLYGIRNYEHELETATILTRPILVYRHPQ